MRDLRFRVLGARALEHSASPLVALSVETRVDDPVDNVLLRVQVRIDASQRAHSDAEKERVREVFGDADVWSRSSKSLLWTQATIVVPGFESATTFDVHAPCGYDFASAAAKYLHGLETGSVPVRLVFSGTVFERTAAGLSASPLSWDHEASYEIPLEVIRGVIDAHFPDSAVVSLGRDVFERLNRYRREQGLSTWTDAVGRLLATATAGGGS